MCVRELRGVVRLLGWAVAELWSKGAGAVGLVELIPGGGFGWGAGAICRERRKLV